MQNNLDLSYTPFWFFGERKGFKLESIEKVSEVEETLGIKYWLVFFKDKKQILTFTSTHCCFGERDRLVSAMERVSTAQAKIRLEAEMAELIENVEAISNRANFYSEYNLSLMEDWFTPVKY